MTATVYPLNARTAVKIAELQRAPMPSTRVLSPEARQAFSSLDGRMNALRRVFSGPFATESQAAEIERLANEIRADALRVVRLAR